MTGGAPLISPSVDSEAPSSTDLDRLLSSVGVSERARLAGRVILHLRSHHSESDDRIADAALTQRGITEALSVTTGAVSKVLVLLVAADVLRESRSHVAGESRRVKTYGLTPRGILLADRLRALRGSGSVTSAKMEPASDRWV